MRSIFVLGLFFSRTDDAVNVANEDNYFFAVTIRGESVLPLEGFRLKEKKLIFAFTNVNSR